MKYKISGLLAAVAIIGAFLTSSSFAQSSDRSGFERTRERSVPADLHRPAISRAGHRGNPERLVTRFDSDNDGQLSFDEFLDSRIALIDQNFDRLDRNDDGLVDAGESSRPDHHGAAIDRAEVRTCVREILAAYDADHALDERFDYVDLDGDGYIDLAELSAALEARAHVLFARLDTDGDDFISLAELEAALQQQINLRRVVRACIDQVSDPVEPDTDL
ncbi:MAG: EF-hand domain-containing protein [Pseudomonadales bacterium]|nr:EF-hand domain-containing protein [Pseudomonadales bacterium]